MGEVDVYSHVFLTSSLAGSQLHAQGKSVKYPLDRKLGGPQSRSGRRGEEKILATSQTTISISGKVMLY
jgi:hypothetical protein